MAEEGVGAVEVGVAHVGELVVARVAVGEAVRHGQVDEVGIRHALAFGRLVAGPDFPGLRHRLAAFFAHNLHLAGLGGGAMTEVEKSVVGILDGVGFHQLHAGVADGVGQRARAGAVHQHLHAGVFHAHPPVGGVHAVDGRRFGLRPAAAAVTAGAAGTFESWQRRLGGISQLNGRCKE